MRRTALALSLGLAFLAGCETSTSTPDPTGNTSCRVVRVIDGDTVDLTCTETGSVRARLTGFDTPEITSPGCAEEYRLGMLARQRLTALVRGATRVDVDPGGWDRYGRRLVRLSLDGQDVARTLVSEGLAVRYTGGRRIAWCAIQR